MISTNRYKLRESIYDGQSVTVHRAYDTQTDAVVVLKIAKPGAHCAEKVQREYNLAKDIALPGVVPVRGIEEHGGRWLLIREDVGGETLAARISRSRLPLSECLRITSEIAEALGQLHSKYRIIHKDVNPNNIVLDRSGHARLLDFDIATRLPREVESIQTPNQIVGTLAYIAPEQTGRMNRAIDYRSDLYSLGVVAYLMLTGQLPFPTSNPSELVHSHIAKIPVPPSELDPSIPAIVSDIVMKLLDKMADSRYQSAFGLREDLENCRQQLDKTGHIVPFELGQKNRSGRFLIPQTLYGRGESIEALQAALGRVHQDGAPELALVTGKSGIGKTSVVHELYRTLVQTRGYFVSGKFEQLKRDIPYSALFPTLTELIRNLLAESDDQLVLMRRRIKAAVGTAGRVLTDVLPELARIIGPQEAVPEVSAVEAKNRFRIVFEKFVHAFTQHGEPLVIFLDDVQWADAATLEFLRMLLCNPRAGALLVIASYRDDEVFAGDPLLSTIAAAEEAHCRVTRIPLEGLSVDHVTQLVADTLSTAADEAWTLGELIWRRTEGNPFFVAELLTSLHRNGLIQFDTDKGCWSFDPSAIASASGTESIGRLMAARAAALGERAQETLKLASVLGNQFELEQLALVAERPSSDIAEALEEALQEDLLLQIKQGDQLGYRFVHDRVQQTVYSMLTEEARTTLHYRIGKLLLQKGAQDERERWVFEVLHHLNLAAELLQDSSDRLEVAQLNLVAARRGRASAAFAAAMVSYRAAMELMSEDAWESHHDLMFELCLGEAECAYVIGDYACTDARCTMLIDRAQTALERLSVYQLIAAYKVHLGKFAEALDTMLDAVATFGIEIPREPKLPTVLIEFLKTKHALKGRTPAQLAALQEVTEPWVLKTLNALMDISAIGFFVNPIFTLIGQLWVARMTMEHGNSYQAPNGYMAYAVISNLIVGNYEVGEQFAQLALALNEKYPNKGTECRIKMSYGGSVVAWRHPVRQAYRYLTESWQAGVMAGDLMTACFAIDRIAYTYLHTAHPLEACIQECGKLIDFVEKAKLEATLLAVRMYRQAALTLRGESHGLGSFDSDEFNEAAYLEEGAKISEVLLYYHRVCKMMVLYVLGRHEEALEISAACRKGAGKALGPTITPVDFYYYDALLLTSVAGRKNAISRNLALLIVRRHLRKLQKWAQSAPMNFLHKYLIVSAEVARLAQDEDTAIGKYEKAIALAHDNGFLQDEGIALELVSRLYRQQGLPDLAITYLARARQAYARWGALAKVTLLDNEYPGLNARTEHRQSVSTTATSTASGESFDTPTMIKASQALSSEIVLEKLLIRLMDIVAESAGAQRGAVILKRQGYIGVFAEFTVKQGTRLLEPAIALSNSTNISAGIVNYAMRTQETVVLDDATKEGAFTHDPYVSRQQPKAVLCIPFTQKGEVLGALYLENNLVAGAFTAERAELLKVLCSQLAISIDNASLYADLEQRVAERTRELREAQARLIEMEREATETQMAGGFAHEMRNALSTAKLALHMVLKKKKDESGDYWSTCVDNSGRLLKLYNAVRSELEPGSLGEITSLVKEMNKSEQELHGVLVRISQSVERGLRITGLILDYSQLGRNRRGTMEVALVDIVDAIIGELRERIHENRISVDVNISPTCILRGHEEHFYSIVRNLVENAYDALVEREDDLPRQLWIHSVDNPDNIVFLVRDTGVGIPPDQQERIFEAFVSTKPARGTGLGLGVVRKLVTLYGGKVRVAESVPMKGTTFEVILPKDEPVSAMDI